MANCVVFGRRCWFIRCAEGAGFRFRMTPTVLFRSHVWLALLLLASCGGCRLLRLGQQGPVPKAVAKCRQLSGQGVTAMQQGDWRGAEVLLRRAIESCPVNAPARGHLAEILWHRGALDLAAKQLEEARALAPDEATYSIRAGELYLALGRPQLARSRANDALDAMPETADAWTLRGQANQQLGAASAALADYHQALAYAPNDRRVMLLTAQLDMANRRPERALPILSGLMDSYPPGQQPQSLLALEGCALAQLGRHEDAAASYALALRIGPPSADLLAALGDAQFMAGRSADAHRSASRALALDPRHAESQHLLGRIGIARRGENDARY